MTNTSATAQQHAELDLPVLPERYQWHIRPDQGDGEFQLYPKGSTLLITLDRHPWGGRLHGRATGAPGYYVNSDASAETIEETAREIYAAWQRFLTRRAELESRKR